jgi:hypothetical protein
LKEKAEKDVEMIRIFVCIFCLGFFVWIDVDPYFIIIGFEG